MLWGLRNRTNHSTSHLSRIALIQLDQAGADVTSALRWPENLIPVCQPAHSPELNPIERVWQFIKHSLIRHCEQSEAIAETRRLLRFARNDKTTNN